MIKEFVFPKDDPEVFLTSLGLKHPDDYEVWNYPTMKISLYGWDNLNLETQKSIRNRYTKLGFGERDINT